MPNPHKNYLPHFLSLSKHLTCTPYIHTYIHTYSHTAPSHPHFNLNPTTHLHPHLHRNPTQPLTCTLTYTSLNPTTHSYPHLHSTNHVGCARWVAIVEHHLHHVVPPTHLPTHPLTHHSASHPLIQSIHPLVNLIRTPISTSTQPNHSLVPSLTPQPNPTTRSHHR